MSKVFLDTNLLVYALDKADPVKQTRARSLLQSLQRDDLYGVISTQILQEFYVVSTKKLRLDPLLAKSILHTFANFETVLVSPELIGQAIDCSILNRLSFWDALVVVSAESACCEKIWSEDLNHGQTIRGVTIENPFF
jgi:predicted nucleic acid-binding protein